MSRVVKVYQILRNNWKKTVFFSGVASYGTYWGYGKYREFITMKSYCEKAVIYGEQKLLPLLPTRHVTVILNPVANKKKAKADYEKYCAPLFHLAGLKVSLVITEAEGQAKDLMEIMDNTNCVVVAGGDGTVHEVVTGLLRRNDASFATKKFHIGIVPVGQHNTVAYKLNQNIYSPSDMKAKILGESSMMIIREVLHDVDVLKIEGDQGRPVYSLGQLNVGQIRNTIEKLDQYWYLGQTMKPYLTFFFQSFKNLSDLWDDSRPIEISYTKPCTGCSKCYHRFEDISQLTQTNENANKTTQSSKRWWHMFLPRNNTQNQIIDPKTVELERIKSTINEECDQLHTATLNSKNILVRNIIEKSEMEIIVHTSDLKQSDFVKEGIRISKNQDYLDDKNLPFYSLKAKDVCINMPIIESETSETVLQEELSAQDDDQTLSNGEIEENPIGSFLLSNSLLIESPNAIKELPDTVVVEESNVIDRNTNDDQLETETTNSTAEAELESNQWLSIDNESYEYQSTLRISLLPKKVQIYHGS